VDVGDRRARQAAGIYFFVQGLCFAGLLSQVPTLQHKLDVSDAELSLILPLVPIIAGVGSVLAGVFAPRFGSSRLLRLTGPLVPVAIALVGVVPNKFALYPAIALVGLLLGAVDATMNMQAVAVQTRYGRSLLASFHATWSVGGILGALVTAGSHLDALDLPLAAGLGLVAAAGLLIDVIGGRGLLDRAEESGARRGEAAAPVPAPRIPWRPIMLVGLAVTIVYIADSATSNFSTKYLQDVLHAAASVAPLGLAAYLTFQLLGRALADRQVNRFGAVRPVALGGVVGVVGMTVVALAPAPIWAVVGFGAVGLGLSVVVPMSFSAAGVLDPTNSGVAIARVNLFNYVGFVVGAGLTGAVASAASLRWAFAVPAVLAVGVVVLAPSFRMAGVSAIEPLPAVAEPSSIEPSSI
jgi:MFS family permease